jgi:DNA-binding XRE family transcriptional regulator
MSVLEQHAVKRKAGRVAWPLVKGPQASQVSRIDLEKILGLWLRQDRIAYAVPSKYGRSVLIRFGDNRRYDLALERIEDFDDQEIVDVRIETGGSEMVVVGSSGHEVTIPWDYVLYKCDRDYAAMTARKYGAGRSPQEIGKRIRVLREQRNMDISTFAKLSGLARPNVHRLEGGLHRPQMETLAKAAKVLGVPITDLLRTG